MARLSNIQDEEWENRINLAACYHLADFFGWSDIIWNHITAKTSKSKNTFLINKFGLRYDEISASNLLEIDLEGNIINGDGCSSLSKLENGYNCCQNSKGVDDCKTIQNI